MARSRVVGNLDINVLLAFIFGVLFLLITLCLVVFVNNLSDLARWVIVITMALAGAGFASVIPGILKIDFPYVKSGGALAVFVLILSNQPKIVNTAENITTPNVIPTISDYLKSVDSKQLDQAWDTLDEHAKTTIAADKDLYKAVYENGRYILGDVIERSPPIGTSTAINPPGYPTGLYRSILFKTKFSENCHEESLSARLDDENKWHVFTHNVSNNTVPCKGLVASNSAPIKPTQ